MAQLPLLALEHLIKASGALRIGEDAKEELRKILESELERLSKKAETIAHHSGRKTITEGDLRIAQA